MTLFWSIVAGVGFGLAISIAVIALIKAIARSHRP